MEPIEFAVTAVTTAVCFAIALMARWWLCAFVVLLVVFAHGAKKRDQNLAECQVGASRALAHDELAGNMATEHSSTGYILVQKDDQVRDCMTGKGYDISVNGCPQSARDDSPTNIAVPECFSRTWANTMAAQVR
jgi:hypothetical protein